MKGDRIEESSVRLLSRSSSSGGGSSESRWVDGSEVDWDEVPPPWSNKHHGNDGGSREGYGSLRRRLVKKPKRVDSFDVEAMEIAGGSHGHHSNVKKVISHFFIMFISFLLGTKKKYLASIILQMFYNLI